MTGPQAELVGGGLTREACRGFIYPYLHLELSTMANMCRKSDSETVVHINSGRQIL